MDEVSRWVEASLGIGPEIQHKLLVSLLVIVVIWLARWIVVRVTCRRLEEARSRYRLKKISTYLSVFLAVLIVGRVWFQGIQSLATYLGLVSAGLAIALKDPVVDLAGWLFILWRRPFEVGDRIQIGDKQGDVIDLRIFEFTLMEIGNWVAADQSTGRIIHIPNGRVFTEPVANSTTGFQFIWNEIPVLVTFESDWSKAKGLLQGIADKRTRDLSETARKQVRRAARKFLIFYANLTPTVYTSVVDSGVLLTVRHLCDPRQRRGVTQALWEDILAEFARHDDIDFAYPTRRYYDNRLEGKPGAKAGPPAAPDAGNHSAEPAV